jgi:subfamily B ATP-binding cassette protein MsbA
LTRGTVPGEQAPIGIYRRLLGYTARYWQALVVAAIALIVYAATDTGFAALMKPLLDEGLVKEDMNAVRRVLPILIGITIVRGLSGFASEYAMNLVARRVIARLRGEVFEHFLRLPSSYYDRSSLGVLLSKLTYNIEQVAESTTKSVTVAIRDTFTIIALIGWMIWIHAGLAVLILILAPLVGALVRFLSRRFRRYSGRIQDSMGDVTRVTEQVLAAHRVVKVFNGQDYERERFDEFNERNRRSHMRLAAAKAIGEPVIMQVGAFGIAVVIYFATTSGLTPGDFVSFLSAMLLVTAPLKRLTNINASLQQGIAAGQSIFALLDTPVEEGGQRKLQGRARGDVEYRSVTFAYSAEKGAVLRDVSLVIPAGRTVAFVGKSGSGKTTLVSLLPRFYDPDEGQVLLDGHDIREYTLPSLREQIALVSQEVVLFNDTIANNIAYGSLAGASREQITQAARAANVLAFAEDLPEGLDTLVGDRGVLLSGGQRQRIAIARALLKDAPVLILDEATSALDSESERQIQLALEELMRNRTTLVIAHRLSTTERADLIVVLADGRIVETGTHAELLARNADYANLHRMQFRESEPAEA